MVLVVPAALVSSAHKAILGLLQVLIGVNLQIMKVHLVSPELNKYRRCQLKSRSQGQQTDTWLGNTGAGWLTVTLLQSYTSTAGEKNKKIDPIAF